MIKSALFIYHVLHSSHLCLYKALIHTLAGKARGFPIKSIGSLVNEPFTGLLYLKVSYVPISGQPLILPTFCSPC